MSCSSGKGAPGGGGRSGGAHTSHPGSPIPWAETTEMPVETPEPCVGYLHDTRPATPEPPASLCNKSGALQGLLGAVAGIWWLFTEPKRVRTTNIFLLSWHGSHQLFSPRLNACSRVLPPVTLRSPRSQPTDVLLFLSPLCCPQVLVALALSKGKDQLQAGRLPWSSHVMGNEGPPRSSKER